jgi:hypothetical protein
VSGISVWNYDAYADTADNNPVTRAFQVPIL